MAKRDTTQITKRELREAELRMTGPPPAPGTGFIGFVPARPANADDCGAPEGNAGGRRAETQ